MKKSGENGGLQKFPNIYRKTAKNGAKIRKLHLNFWGATKIFTFLGWAMKLFTFSGGHEKIGDLQKIQKKWGAKKISKYLSKNSLK